jgi:ferric-dicitrate binding protein FerR (iron transport regulator)
VVCPFSWTTFYIMDQDRIDVLLARCLTGELTPEENEELEWAMLADPNLRVTLQVLRRMEETPVGANAAEEKEMMDRGWARLHEPAPVPQAAVVVRHWWRRAAAAAVLVAGVGVALLYRGSRHEVISRAAAVQPAQNREIATRYGTRSYQELPDGSKLWLNAGSKVTYAEGRRELTLTGEAFFDIKHDPEHPFIIHTGKLDIKVLGTSFNIKAYPNDTTIETTLITGKVEIDLPGREQAIVLRPSEKLVIPVRETLIAPGGSVAVARQSVTPDPQYKTVLETSWVEDKLVFRNEAFSEVSRKLERWYNIHIRFEDNRYLQDKLTAYFKDQPIRNVMDALQITLGFHYRIEGDTIHITSK